MKPILKENEIKVNEEMQTVAIPCGHSGHASGCHFCNLAAKDERYAKLFQREPRKLPIENDDDLPPDKKHQIDVIKNRCISLGKIISPSPECGCGSLFECANKQIKECRKLAPGPTGSATCLNCSFRKTRNEDRQNPKAGIVIGTYGYPNLVALQVKLIRKHNPLVPIMLVDDHSDGTQMTPLSESNFGKLCTLSKQYENVKLWSNPVRMGHAGGDLTSFFCGLQWANYLSLDVLVKLSFRFIVDIDNWVQTWINDFWPTGWATSSQRCKEGNTVFEIRSECMMMDVKQWHTKEILDHIRPRPLGLETGKFGVAAENVLWDDIRDRLDNGMHKCKFFGEDRCARSNGVLWHLANGKEEYIALHQREGLEIDPNYTNCGWMNQPGYKG